MFIFPDIAKWIELFISMLSQKTLQTELLVTGNLEKRIIRKEI